jgi:hypothetical protein
VHTICIYPTDPYIATRDHDGKIKLWYFNTGNAKKSLKDKVEGAEKERGMNNMHWHAHAVACTAFSSLMAGI